MAQKRGEYNSNDLHRHRRKEKISGDFILIVCEGGKTEPSYFNQLKRKWRIHPAQIEVVGDACGSAPISVVDHAIQRRDERRRNVKKGGAPAFDQVWCVFDHEGKNKHKTYDEAMEKAKAHKLNVAFSIPSFEFWYLLHFEYTTSQFKDCDEVARKLKKYIPDYDKSKAPLDKLIPLLDDAVKNAAALRKALKTSGAVGPATEVDLLVKELMCVKPIR